MGLASLLGESDVPVVFSRCERLVRQVIPHHLRQHVLVLLGRLELVQSGWICRHFHVSGVALKLACAWPIRTLEQPAPAGSWLPTRCRLRPTDGGTRPRLRRRHTWSRLRVPCCGGVAAARPVVPAAYPRASHPATSGLVEHASAQPCRSGTSGFHFTLAVLRRRALAVATSVVSDMWARCFLGGTVGLGGVGIGS